MHDGNKTKEQLFLELESLRRRVAELEGLETEHKEAALALQREVEERHRVEEALRQSLAELQMRNEELNAFAHTVAHDLQNPLTIVIGTAETLAEEFVTMSSKELKLHLCRIARSGRKLDSIVDELLLLSQVREGEVVLTPLDMRDIVADALQRLVELVEETEAEIVMPDTWPVALGYSPWVEEVWVNYLSNAIKYGGRPPRVELGAAAEADSGGPPVVRFWAHDNGPGLAAEEQAELFMPFRRLDQVRAQGYGLGLSIVRRIVEKLGGEVSVESEGMPGRGSVFSFTLPGVVYPGKKERPARAAGDRTLAIEEEA